LPLGSSRDVPVSLCTGVTFVFRSRLAISLLLLAPDLPGTDRSSLSSTEQCS